jgi:hypothetical protein
MTRWILTLGMLFWIQEAVAQERVPDEEAKQVAQVLIEAAGRLKAPLKIEVDSGKAYAKRRDEYGVMLLPAKKLSADAISRAGKEIVPVGQIWLRNLAPVVENKVLSSKKLHMVSVTYKEHELNLGLCFIGVQNEKDKPALVILSKEKTPLITLPLELADQKQELPLEFLVSIEEDRRATLTLQIAGKYRAKLPVGALTD